MYRTIASQAFIVKGALHLPECTPLKLRNGNIPWQLWAEGDYMLDFYFYRSTRFLLQFLTKLIFMKLPLQAMARHRRN
ncbi:hypothetical protein D7X94_17180 [Acutalibacter sp. 1XD8-33]|nr:hypothetical protein D7X94_17180 [Acutalibacter sp. 1XD8-33]